MSQKAKSKVDVDKKADDGSLRDEPEGVNKKESESIAAMA